MVQPSFYTVYEDKKKKQFWSNLTVPKCDRVKFILKVMHNEGKAVKFGSAKTFCISLSVLCLPSRAI